MSAVNFAHEDINELETSYDENALVRLKDYLMKRINPELSESALADLTLVEEGGGNPEVYERLRSYLASTN